MKKQNRVNTIRFNRKSILGRSKAFHGLVWVLAICGVLTCTYMVLAKATRPYVISYAESQDMTSIKQQKEAAEAENRRLKLEKDYLLTSKGKEAEARKLGWVKPGEVAVVVQQPEKPVPVLEYEKPPVPKSKWQLLSEKAMRTLFFRGDKK